MGHFAKVENGTVTQVIVAEQDFIDTGVLHHIPLGIQVFAALRQTCIDEREAAVARAVPG